MGKIIKHMVMAAGLPVLLGAAVCFCCFTSKAADIPGLENNRYVTLSPDGNAFTIGYGDKTVGNYSQSEIGKTVNAHGFTGIAESKEGEHTYRKMICGAVPVAYWKLVMAHGSCIHSGGTNYRINSLNLMGANTGNCRRNYNAGWFPYCAVCGEKVENLIFYMTEDMAAETKYLPSGISSATYFYLCPYDNSLENHNPIRHICTLNSTNRYRIEYYGSDEAVTGYMDTDIFYYEPGEKYEGNDVTAKECLSLCGFKKDNYRFIGWSTEKDGKAVIKDGENWMTVREVTGAGQLDDNSVIKLYAVWECEEGGEKYEPDDNEINIELVLDADIKRVLFNTDGVETFLPGESGDLNINVSGKPDRVVVEFPAGLEEYNCTFDYSETDSDVTFHNEKIRFMIPIDGTYTKAESLTVTVTAYRGNENVNSCPIIILRENGSILDDLRTCLR